MMQEGIGLGGYRILAYVFSGLGVLGLVLVAVGGGGATLWVGLLLAAVALLALTGVSVMSLGLAAGGALRSSRAARPTARAPDEAVPLPTPEPPAVADPDADLGFEYPDGSTPQPAPAPPAAPAAAQPAQVSVSSKSPWSQPAAEPGPMFEAAPVPLATTGGRGARSLPAPPPRPATRTPPPPMVRPRAASAPPAGKSAADAGGWPERKAPAGVTRRQVAERGLPRDPGPTVEVEGPGPVRRDPPIVMARTVASAEATGIPEGTGVGKCGNCGVLLLAPKKRPIRLQCPRCERVHLLS